MKKNLVIARCGDKSLHPQWTQGAQPDFDLVITYYGERLPEAWVDAPGVLEVHHIPGSKWRGLHRYLASTHTWRLYDRILLPDDDLSFDAATLNALFATCETLGADLAQPALDTQSYFSHAVTLMHPSFNWRFTNWVEVMCPCLSRRLLEAAWPWFGETESGWGLDFQWAEIVRAQGWFAPVIIDTLPITHTRPVGSAGHGTDGSIDPGTEMKDFLARLGLDTTMTMTLGGQLKSGEMLTFTEYPSLLATVVASDLIGKVGQMPPLKIAFEVINMARAMKLS